MKGKIFNAQEVQAILSGSKVIFREVIKPYPILSEDKSYWEFKSVRWAGENSSYAKNFGDNARPEMPDLCPYHVGEKIFCKESFFANKNHNNLTSKDLPMDSLIMYAAGGGANVYGKKRPAQHMKQEHSRLTLLIKEIGVEKLAEISEEDCWKEGLEELADYQDQVKVCQMAKQLGECIEDPRPHFATYWNATYKEPEEKFEANPWVWVVSFEIINN